MLYCGMFADPAVALTYFSEHRSGERKDRGDKKEQQHETDKGGVTIPSQMRCDSV
jgi:hypothetical protein